MGNGSRQGAAQEVQPHLGVDSRLHSTQGPKCITRAGIAAGPYFIWAESVSGRYQITKNDAGTEYVLYAGNERFPATGVYKNSAEAKTVANELERRRSEHPNEVA